ncbi:hypothetical protein [Streptomyces virginiae]|uniref:hypothetical protein n=1 Tax=Streptomyces virginiae TaxID=1961 RepID=UPI00342810B1
MAAAARKDDSKPAEDGAAAAAQHAADKAQEQGFYGVETDPTPNEHYTVAGVVAGKPTPETDKDAAAEARKAAGLL